MTHEIFAPTEIEDVLYQEPLEFTHEAIEEVQKQGGNKPIKGQWQPPIVTLGTPQCWNLAALARESGRPLPDEIALLGRESDFYLVQLACSFRPGPNSYITWARLNVFLRPKVGHKTPIAFDLYPRRINNETRTNIKIGLAPSLKFVETEVSLGEIVTTIEYHKLEPVIVGYGLLQSNPGWDFDQHKKHPLQGSKVSYLIVKKPHGAEAVRMTLDIIVDIETTQGILSARLKEKDHENLSQVICTN